MKRNNLDQSGMTLQNERRNNTLSCNDDLEKTVVHCTTKKQFIKVLEWHESKGHLWIDKNLPLFNNGNDFDRFSDRTSLSLKDRFIYGSVDDLKEGTNFISFDIFQKCFLNEEDDKSMLSQKGVEPSIKNDFKDNKLRWDLLPLGLIEEVVRVYDAGAKKYGANRWQNLENGKSRYFAAMMRHIRASQIEDVDEDTGCYHLAQVCFNALAMLHFKLKENEKK